MKNLTIFYLEGCPYCRNARRALGELTAENADYGKVGIEWIEETRRPELAEQYDYYHVPAVFCGKDKLYEAHPSEGYAECRENMRAALEAARQG